MGVTPLVARTTTTVIVFVGATTNPGDKSMGFLSGGNVESTYIYIYIYVCVYIYICIYIWGDF